MTPVEPGRRSLAWLSAAVLLCAFPASRWLAASRDDRRLPSSPVDRTDGERGRQWMFLESCRPHVPPGAPMSVVARDGRIEMALFMMAIGVFPDNVVLSRTYYLRSTPEEFRRAEWILAFGAEAPGIEEADLVARVRDGAVYRRRPPR